MSIGLSIALNTPLKTVKHKKKPADANPPVEFSDKRSSYGMYCLGIALSVATPKF
jgi:hypothetical protein